MAVTSWLVDKSAYVRMQAGQAADMAEWNARIERGLVTPDQRRWRSLTTTDTIAPTHPGEILVEDFIKGFGNTQNKVAASIGVPPRCINEIVHRKRGITADTAQRQPLHPA